MGLPLWVERVIAVLLDQYYVLLVQIYKDTRGKERSDYQIVERGNRETSTYKGKYKGNITEETQKRLPVIFY